MARIVARREFLQDDFGTFDGDVAVARDGFIRTRNGSFTDEYTGPFKVGGSKLSGDLATYKAFDSGTLIGVFSQINRDAQTALEFIFRGNSNGLQKFIFDGDDKFFLSSGSDRARGQSGDDVMLGRNGFDTLFGGSGEDRLVGGTGSDFLKGGTDNDKVFGGAGGDRAVGDAGNDIVSGGGGNDIVVGARGDDRLFGNAGNDRIFGGSGDDRIAGGKGNDFLVGGSGADVFAFSAADGADRVRGFEQGVDQIDIAGANRLRDLTIEQEGANTVITFRNTEVTLIAEDADGLKISDFIF